jgi:hypothetical protein
MALPFLQPYIYSGSDILTKAVLPAIVLANELAQKVAIYKPFLLKSVRILELLNAIVTFGWSR